MGGFITENWDRIIFSSNGSMRIQRPASRSFMGPQFTSKDLSDIAFMLVQPDRRLELRTGGVKFGIEYVDDDRTFFLSVDVAKEPGMEYPAWITIEQPGRTRQGTRISDATEPETRA